MNKNIACHECDLLQQLPELNDKTTIHCARCDAVLLKWNPNGLEYALACSIAALFFLLASNLFPIIELNAGGQSSSILLWESAISLVKYSQTELAILTIFTCIMAPLTYLVTTLHLLLPLKLGLHPIKAKTAFFIQQLTEPWSMVGIYLLGVFVAIVKLMDMADVIPGVALFSLIGAVMCIAAVRANFDSFTLWSNLQKHHLNQEVNLANC